MDWRKFIPVTMVVVMATASVHADMVLTSKSADACDRSMPVYGASVAPAVDVAGPSLDLSPENMPVFPSVPMLPEVDADVQNDESPAEAVVLLNNDRGSVEWCLYALMGFGLCKSAPLFRKLSIGFVPDWYHHGGPYQIGASYAVGPDCLCVAAICFSQPETDSTPRFGFVSLPQRSLSSQCALAAHTSRGPPQLS